MGFFRYSDLSDWIHKRYDALFSDEDHWLLVLSAGNPDNDSKWFIREIHGDNTEDVLTPYVIEKFTSELQDKLNHASESEDYSIGNVVCASFYEFYKRELSGGPVDIGAAAFWVFVLILAITLYGILLFFLYINLKYIFVKYIFKTRLFQIGYTLFKKETICPVCCGSYVINIHSECPHCGVKIKRAPYGTSCHSDKNINASSPVFDNIGSYGGDQLDIYRQAGRYFFDCVFSYNKELFETARSYPKFKDYTNREISDLFRSISIEGCGYVAVVNAIFVHFKNDNKRFEKLFGFSMIGTDGDYNFNRLFLDFHVNTDNKIFLDYPYGIEHLMRSTYSYYKRFKNAFAIKFGTPIFDEKNKNAFSLKAAQAVLDTYENDSVVTLDAERGVNPFSLSNRLLYYLDQHGITATVEHKENLYIYEVNQQLTDNKTIIISAHGYSLYYTEEDLEKQNPAFLNGRGHAMVIVGTTNKDNCIVSSWGNMYYLHLSDVYKKEFLIVDIKS